MNRLTRAKDSGMPGQGFDRPGIPGFLFFSFFKCPKIINIGYGKEPFPMKKISALLVLLSVLLLLMPAAPGEAPEGEDPIVVICVRDAGDIYVRLDPEAAPVTVKNFLKLTDSGFYNGLTFHRIINGFMVQGGDPLGNGTGGADETIPGEFSQNGWENPLSHTRGVISMARSSDMDSASSQFFIMHADAPHLDGAYAAFGQVLTGMDVVDALCINAAVTDSNGSVSREDRPVITLIRRASLEEAVSAAEKAAQNGAAGGVYLDPVTSASFPVPEGFALSRSSGTSVAFSDGTDSFYFSSVDQWKRLGHAGQEAYAAHGFDRKAFDTSALSKDSIASGTDAKEVSEETHGGILWYTVTFSMDGITARRWVGMDNGNMFVLTAGGENAIAGAVTVLESIDNGFAGNE